MNKFMRALLATGVLISGSAIAATGTFDVTVDVQNASKDLRIDELTAISFPSIVVDDSTKAGDKCYTSYAASNYSTLCRNTTAETGSRTSGTYRINGTPLAPISVQLSAPVLKNGLQFAASLDGNSANTRYATANYSIPGSGNKDITVRGFLELKNPESVTTEQTTFTFDITAAYN